MTQAGIILGTAAYMAPEQAKGKTVDKRADIWAFGCVLYEMLTGRRAFDGDDMTDTIVAVMSREPAWDRLPSHVPRDLRRLLERCLRKDPKARLRDIGDARVEIETTAASPEAPEPPPHAPVPASRPLWKRVVPLAATAIGVAALTAGVTLRLQPFVPASVVRFVVPLAEGQQFFPGTGSVMAISPDGTHLAYTADRRLYVRALADLEPRTLVTPTQGRVELIGIPAFSPDGQSVAFVDAGDAAIKRIGLAGGTPTQVCTPAFQPFGLSWGGDAIFFGAGPDGIMRVPALGGSPETIARVEPGEFADSPVLLPGGTHLLFTIATGDGADRWDKARIVVESLQSHERKTVIGGGADARYLATGHLVYAVGGLLYAVPFDLDGLATRGSPVPIIEGVARTIYPGANSGNARVAISDNGTLVYIPGPKEAQSWGVQGGGQSRVALFDRQGATETLQIPRGPWELPRLSSDGTRFAVGSDDGKTAAIWITELSGTSSIRRLTLGGQGNNRYPVWSADGRRLAFQSDRDGDLGIFSQRADGAGAAERLTQPGEGVAHIPEAWSPDGAHLLYNENVKGTTIDDDGRGVLAGWRRRHRTEARRLPVLDRDHPGASG
jgi:serine/threonine-protein kinase